MAVKTLATPRLHKMVEADASRIGLEPARNMWLRRVNEMIDKSPEIIPQLSIKQLYEAFNDDFVSGRHLQEDVVVSTQFVLLTGNLVQHSMLTGSPDRTSHLVGDQLVTVMPSTQKREVVTGLQAIDNVNQTRTVAEGEEIPRIKFKGEKGCSPPEPEKFARILQLSLEAIKFDQTSQFLRGAAQLGDEGRLERERRIIYGIADQTGSKRYYPDNGKGAFAQVDLYRLLANIDTTKWYKRNETTVVNALTDDTDLDVALQIFANRKDENQRKIVVMPTTILAPMAMQRKFKQVLGITSFKLGADSASEQLMGNLSVTKMFGGSLNLVISRFLDSISTTTWYIGNPKNTFYLQSHWPLRVERDDKVDNFGRDIAASFKISFKEDLIVGEDTEWLRCTAS